MKNKEKESDLPLFFLFTCVKNGRKYIDKLFASLLAQSNTNFVHYIYDDGSSDPIDDLVCEYRKKASKLAKPFNIIYEKNPVNIGLNLSTKHCIDKCYCPYFIWIDCDNWVSENFFEELENTAKANKDCIYIGTNRFDYCDGIAKPYFSESQLHLAQKKKRDTEYFCGNFGYSFFAVKYSMYIAINKDNYFSNDPLFFNDMQVICHCVFSKQPFCFAPNAYSYYLYRDDSEGNSVDYGTKLILSNYGKFYELAKHDGFDNAEYLVFLTSIRLLKRERFFTFKQYGYNACLKLSKNIRMIIKNKRIPWKYRKYLFFNDLGWHINTKYERFFHTLSFRKRTHN